MLKNKSLKRDIGKHSLYLILLMAGFSASNFGHTKTLNICYDQWPPMTIFPSEGSTERGLIIDMLEQIYTEKGYTLNYYEVPLARGLDMVADGLCDLLPEYLYSKNSKKGFVYATEATFAYSSAFVVRRNDPWRYNGIKSIKGKRIATGPGWDYSSMSVDYQNYIENPENSTSVEIIAGDNDVIDRILRMIIDNRVDLYADNDLVLKYLINRLKLNNELEIVYPGLEKKLLEMPIFSTKISTEKRHTLMTIWNEGRRSLKGEKEKKLLEKYQITLEN